MGFLLPIALLLIALAGSKTVRFLQNRSPALGKISAVCAVVLACGLIGYHFYQLSRVYAALSLRDSSAIFLTMERMLQRYDKKETAILVDAFSWHENQMRPFLMSDGWYAERLVETDTLNLKTRSFTRVQFEQLPDQLKRLELAGKRNILILASPMVLKPLLAHGKLLSFEGCLSNREPKRANIYTVLLSDVYYVFSAGSPSFHADADQASLQPFFAIAPWIPDDLYRELLKGAAPFKNPPFPPRNWHEFRNYVEQHTTRIPQISDVNHKICLPEHL
jgi:hypothetical protein